MSPAAAVGGGAILSRQATVLAFSGVMLGALLTAIGQTSFATAVPLIVADLGGLSQYSWVFSAYLLTMTVSIPVYGRLVDLYGSRRIFSFGISVFMLGAVVGATATSMTQVVAARAIQGLGAGALFPLAMAIVAELVPPRDRGKWVAVPSSVLGVAAVLGPASGGWIADHLDWRWVFLSSLPLGMLALLVVVVTLRTPARRAFDGRVDYAGAALLMSGCACLLLAATRTGAGHGWWSADVVGLGGAGAALLVAFVLHERRAPDPMMPIPLFRSRLFVIANAVAFLSGTGMFIALVFVPLYVQAAMGRSATNSGVVLMPMLLALTATSIGSGWIVARTGRYKWAIAGGPALMGLGYLVLVGVDVSAGTGGVALAMVLIGLGIGLLMQNLVLVLQDGAPSRLLGAATGSSTFFRQVGGAFSVALAGGILVAGAAGGADPTAALTHASVSARTAFAEALQPIFLAGPPVMALGLVLALLLPTTPKPPEGGLL